MNNNQLTTYECIRCGNNEERYNKDTKQFRENFICYGHQCFEIGQKRKKIQEEIVKAKKQGRELPEDYKRYEHKVSMGMRK